MKIEDLVPAVKDKIKPGQAVSFNGEDYIFIDEQYVPPLDRMQQAFHGKIHLSNSEKQTFVHYDYLSIVNKSFTSYSREQE